MTVTAPREIILAVTGGIAAFKSAMIASKLAQTGAGVTAVLTNSAQAFIGDATFAALTGRPVATEVFDPAYPMGAHIELARRARLLVVAPATADFLAKAAHGQADDLISTLYLCFTGAVLMAPAMNSEMWSKAAVQRNVTQLRADGVHFVDPEEGWLSCRQAGAGRMADPQKVIAAIDALLAEK